MTCRRLAPRRRMEGIAGILAGSLLATVGCGQESVRVAMAVRGPDVPAGRQIAELATNVDLGVTIAALAGVEPPYAVDGRSLAPLWRGDVPATGWRQSVLLEFIPAVPYLVGGFTIPQYSGLRSGSRKYVEWATGERELYDLSTDPFEIASYHASADAALLQALSDRVQRLSSCSGSDCRSVEEEPVP